MIKMIKVLELINIILSKKMKFCMDVNEHLVKLDSEKTDQSNEFNDNKPDFRSLVCPLGQGQDELLWGRFRHPGLRLDHRFLDHL